VIRLLTALIYVNMSGIHEYPVNHLLHAVGRLELWKASESVHPGH
jgi:hypothetical protein